MHDQIEIAPMGGGLSARIEGKFFSWRDEHTISFSDGRHFRYRWEKLWKGVIQCVGDEKTYLMYQHRGRRLSVFLDDRQIAAISKKLIAIGNGNEYEIEIDSDADCLLVTSMVIIYNSPDDRNDETVTFDLGSIGPQERAFDEDWQPS